MAADVDTITCSDQRSRWENAFRRVRGPLEEFIHDEASSGLLLLLTAILAMVLANSALAHWYESLLHTKVTLKAGPYALSMSIHHWINDSLMVLFFFVVGLEIKREVLVGELADIRQAALPIVAAVGGMAVPALIFISFNPGGETARGWAIPMATDIAFAISAMVLLGKRVPKALIGFLLALAIVDDLGAVVIIALFYTDTISWAALLAAAFFFALLALCNLVGMRRPLPYLILGIFLWLAMLQSGVHATIAGVLTAITVPARSSCSSRMFSRMVHSLLSRFDKADDSGRSIMENDTQQAILRGITNCVHGMEAPLQRLEHALHIWVSFLIIPLFAFANAGIPMDFSTMGRTMLHPVTLGIVAGLVGGKFLGIFGSCWLMIRLAGLKPPQGISLQQLAGVAFLAGIGFTMSIFIGELAFAGQEDLLLKAKTGVMTASLLAGGIGFAWLYRAGGKAVPPPLHSDPVRIQ